MIGVSVSEPHRIVKSTLAILLSVHTINMLHVLIIQTKSQCITSIQLVKKVPHIHSPISKSRVQAPEKRGLTQSRAMERVPEREWKSLLQHEKPGCREIDRDRGERQSLL